ncbi:MAG: flagellar assembly protein FliX [Dongiaceae bacterium]
MKESLNSYFPLSDLLMKVKGPDPLNPTGSVRRMQGRKSVSGSFSSHLTEGVEETTAPAAAMPAPGVGALIGLQDVSQHQGSKGQAKKRGEFLLDMLDEIRHGLLVGGIPRDRLQLLAGMIQAQRNFHLNDPKLLAVIDEIELRAKVELAKYEE